MANITPRRERCYIGANASHELGAEGVLPDAADDVARPHDDAKVANNIRLEFEHHRHGNGMSFRQRCRPNGRHDKATFRKVAKF